MSPNTFVDIASAVIRKICSFPVQPIMKDGQRYEKGKAEIPNTDAGRVRQRVQGRVTARGSACRVATPRRLPPFFSLVIQ